MLKWFIGGGLLEFIAANSDDSNANIGDNDNDDAICKLNTFSNTKYIEEKEINIIDKRNAVIIIIECVFI
ncbi:MAG: hypothetical protein ACRD7F_06305, partial [Nitrososphaeraceae archaeon]